MRHEYQKRHVKYPVTILIGLLMGIGMLKLQGFSEALELADKVRIISNACTIPGMMLIMLGCLVWLSNEGAFVGLGYVMSYLMDRLIPGGRTVKKDEKYYDYAQRKRNKERAPFLFLFISGSCFLAVAIITLVIFYQVR